MKTSGHGHVFFDANGFKASCGGPETCQECARDLQRLVDASRRSGAEDGLEDELQGMCDRAREAT